MICNKCADCFITCLTRKVPTVETLKDATLQKPRECVTNGWPKHRKELPSDVNPYRDYKEEIHEAEGLLMKNHQIIIPATLRKICFKDYMKAIKALLQPKEGQET